MPATARVAPPECPELRASEDVSRGPTIVWNEKTIATVVYFAVFPSVLAYFFWNHAVERIGPNRAGLFMHLMPVFGALFAYLFLGESLLWYHYAGAALIFAGLFVATHSRPGAHR